MSSSLDERKDLRSPRAWKTPLTPPESLRIDVVDMALNKIFEARLTLGQNDRGGTEVGLRDEEDGVAVVDPRP